MQSCALLVLRHRITLERHSVTEWIHSVPLSGPELKHCCNS